MGKDFSNNLGFWTFKYFAAIQNVSFENLKEGGVCVRVCVCVFLNINSSEILIVPNEFNLNHFQSLQPQKLQFSHLLFFNGYAQLILYCIFIMQIHKTSLLLNKWTLIINQKCFFSLALQGNITRCQIQTRKSFQLAFFTSTSSLFRSYISVSHVHVIHDIMRRIYYTNAKYISVLSFYIPPRRWGLEYADYISCGRINTKKKKVCPCYNT